MACKDCIHYDVCLLHEDNFIADAMKNGFCGKFKNKDNLVEVVRCKDCRYKKVGYMQSAYYYCCRQGSGFHHIESVNDFCRYGKRNSWETNRNQ